MKVITHILATALLAGIAAAQTAPASQTVKQNPPQSEPKKNSATPTKTAAKNPFKPKENAAHPAAAPQSKSKGTQSDSTKATAKAPVKAAQSAPKVTSKPAQPTQAKATSKPTQPAQAKPVSKPTPPTQAKAVPKQEPSKPAEAKKEATPEVAAATPRKLPSPGRRDPFVSPLAAAGERGPSSGCTTGKRCLVVDQIVLKGIVQMRTGNFALVENVSKRPYVLHENDSLFNGSVVKITGDSVTFREESNDILGRPVSKEVVKKVSAPAV